MKNFNKNLIISSLIILLLGVFTSLGLAFASGNEQYSKICEEASISRSDNYCGWEECELYKDRTYISDPSTSFYITVFLATIPLFIVARNSKEKLLAWFFGTVVFLSLLFLAQMLMNTFPRVVYSGWQDACWIVEEKTQMLLSILEFNTRPTSLPFDITMMLLFVLIALLGPLFSFLLVKKPSISNSKANLVYLGKVILLTLLFQTLVFICTFPISFVFALTWG